MDNFEYIYKAKVIKEIILKTFKDKKGKYGRYIGEIYLEGEEISLNEQLINEGLAERY